MAHSARAKTSLDGVPIQRIDASLLQDRVYEELREAVLRGDLPAGSRLSVSALSEKLGVSRYPVATSLQRLALEGYVVVIPRQGTFVTQFDSEDYFESLDIRLALERHAAPRCAALATAEDLAELERLIERIEAIPLDIAPPEELRKQYDTYAALTREFHERLIGLARSEALTTTYRFVMDRSRRVGREMAVARMRARFASRLDTTGQSHATHRQLIEALRARDARRLTDLLEEEVERVRFHTRQVLKATNASS